MSNRFLRATEVAKLIRVQLKKKWPDHKFSVRSKSYSGGASVNIEYTDGPPKQEVETYVKQYQGARFDAMIDYGWSVSFWLLPDGTVSVARDSGSGVTYERKEYEKPHPDAELVSFGNLYVTVRRNLTRAAVEAIIEQLRADPIVGDEAKLLTPVGSDAHGYRVGATDGFRAPEALARAAWKAEIAYNGSGLPSTA